MLLRHLLNRLQGTSYPDISQLLGFKKQQMYMMKFWNVFYYLWIGNYLIPVSRTFPAPYRKTGPRGELSLTIML